MQELVPLKLGAGRMRPRKNGPVALEAGRQKVGGPVQRTESLNDLCKLWSSLNGANSTAFHLRGWAR